MKKIKQHSVLQSDLGMAKALYESSQRKTSVQVGAELWMTRRSQPWEGLGQREHRVQMLPLITTLILF